LAQAQVEQDRGMARVARLELGPRGAGRFDVGLGQLNRRAERPAIVPRQAVAILHDPELVEALHRGELAAQAVGVAFGQFADHPLPRRPVFSLAPAPRQLGLVIGRIGDGAVPPYETHGRIELDHLLPARDLAFLPADAVAILVAFDTHVLLARARVAAPALGARRALQHCLRRRSLGDDAEIGTAVDGRGAQAVGEGDTELWPVDAAEPLDRDRAQRRRLIVARRVDAAYRQRLGARRRAPQQRAAAHDRPRQKPHGLPPSAAGKLWPSPPSSSGEAHRFTRQPRPWAVRPAGYAVRAAAFRSTGPARP